jgi:hypothetical protein
LSIYPNPCTTSVTISDAMGADLKIADMTGKTIIQHPIISNTHQINVEDLPRGVYMFIFTKTGTLKTLKVVKN